MTASSARRRQAPGSAPGARDGGVDPADTVTRPDVLTDLRRPRLAVEARTQLLVTPGLGPGVASGDRTTITDAARDVRAQLTDEER